MKRFSWVVLAAAWCLAGLAQAGDPTHAVVWIPSHGGSGMTVASEKGRTVIVTCEHLFDDAAARARRIEVRPYWGDAPGQENRDAKVHLVKTVPEHDLALLVVDDGPWPHVAPLAPKDYAPSKKLYSVGYDRMELPAKAVRATLFGHDDLFWFARELMVPGRSGGGLVDEDGGFLVGIVSRGTEAEARPGRVTWPGKRGLYVHRDRIAELLDALKGR